MVGIDARPITAHVHVAAELYTEQVLASGVCSRAGTPCGTSMLKQQHSTLISYLCGERICRDAFSPRCEHLALAEAPMLPVADLALAQLCHALDTYVGPSD